MGHNLGKAHKDPNGLPTQDIQNEMRKLWDRMAIKEQLLGEGHMLADEISVRFLPSK
jgi:hypothetical protein